MMKRLVLAVSLGLWTSCAWAVTETECLGYKEKILDQRVTDLTKAIDALKAKSSDAYQDTDRILMQRFTLSSTVNTLISQCLALPVPSGNTTLVALKMSIEEAKSLHAQLLQEASLWNGKLDAAITLRDKDKNSIADRTKVADKCRQASGIIKSFNDKIDVLFAGKDKIESHSINKPSAAISYAKACLRTTDLDLISMLGDLEEQVAKIDNLSARIKSFNDKVDEAKTVADEAKVYGRYGGASVKTEEDAYAKCQLLQQLADNSERLRKRGVTTVIAAPVIAGGVVVAAPGAASAAVVAGVAGGVALGGVGLGKILSDNGTSESGNTYGIHADMFKKATSRRLTGNIMRSNAVRSELSRHKPFIDNICNAKLNMNIQFTPARL